jgi:type IX secretion system PorP/SprF family membrane protein
MKKISQLLLLVFSSVVGFAQQLPFDNQYMLNTYTINPAFAGENGNIEAFLGYRASWVGIEGAPKLASVNLNGVMLGKMGFGVSVKRESAGSFEHLYGDLAYAYHLKLADEIYVSLGMEGSLYRNQFDNSKVLSDGLDPLLENVASLQGTTFDAGAGIGFWAKGFTFGASVKRIIGGRIDYGGDAQKFFYKPNMEIDGFLSYMIAVGGKPRGRRAKANADNAPSIRVEPQAMVRYTDAQLFWDAAINVMFKDRFWFGGIFRNGGTVGVSVGGALQERIIMNYSYDFGMGNALAAQSSGSHEISIGFLLKARARDRFNRGRTLFLLDGPVNSSGPALEGKDTRVDQILKDLKAATDTLENYKKRTDARLVILEADVDDLKKRIGQKKDDVQAGEYEPPFIIENIKFGYNSDRLFPSSFPELDKLAKKMTDNPKLEIKITGFTDNMGSAQYNERLSERRAKSVGDYLSTKGVTPIRIKIFGKGQADPIGDNNTKEGKEMNRRIEGAFKRIK